MVPVRVAAMETALVHPDAVKSRAERLKASVASRFTVARAVDDVLAFYAERPDR